MMPSPHPVRISLDSATFLLLCKFHVQQEVPKSSSVKISLVASYLLDSSVSLSSGSHG